MKAIETAVLKLKDWQWSAPPESESSLTKSEIESLIAAGELLATLVRAVEELKAANTALDQP